MLRRSITRIALAFLAVATLVAFLAITSPAVAAGVKVPGIRWVTSNTGT